MGRRSITAAVLLVILQVLAASPVAAKPDKGCPADASDWIRAAVDLEWELGDGVPGPGEDHLWDVTAAGTIAEGFSLQQFATLLGLNTVEELYGFALEGWRDIDHNGSGAICIKDGWNPPGQPEYIINLVDDNAAAH